MPSIDNFDWLILKSKLIFKNDNNKVKMRRCERFQIQKFKIIIIIIKAFVRKKNLKFVNFPKLKWEVSLTILN